MVVDVRPLGCLVFRTSILATLSWNEDKASHLHAPTGTLATMIGCAAQTLPVIFQMAKRSSECCCDAAKHTEKRQTCTSKTSELVK